MGFRGFEARNDEAPVTSSVRGPLLGRSESDGRPAPGRNQQDLDNQKLTADEADAVLGGARHDEKKHEVSRRTVSMKKARHSRSLLGQIIDHFE